MILKSQQLPIYESHCPQNLALRKPIAHHNWRHSSQISIPYHGIHQVYGYEIIYSIHLMSFCDCVDLYGGKGTVTVEMMMLGLIVLRAI